MKVIIVKKSLKKFLVELTTNKLVKEVAILVARQKNPEAIAAMLAKGKIEMEITDNNSKDVEADIIVDENGA